MQEKYSIDVITIAGAVVKELQTDETLKKKYQNDLPRDELLTRVCGYVSTLPPASQDRLLERTQDEHGQAKIKGNGISQLADTIGRGFASYNKSRQYNDKEHGKAVYNFIVLQQSKFNENVVSLGSDIVDGLNQGAGKKDLNYNANLNPDFLRAVLEPLGVETNDPQLQARITGLTIGMIAKVAGQATPFKEILKNKQTLPPELVVAIHEAAVVLAQDPKYSNLDKNQAIEVGKGIGKQVRKEVAKIDLDNMQLMRRRETVDTEAVKDTIVTMVLGKSAGKSVDGMEAVAPSVARRAQPDLDGARSVVADVAAAAKEKGVSGQSSSSSRRSDSLRGSHSFVADEDARAKQRAQSKDKGGINV